MALPTSQRLAITRRLQAQLTAIAERSVVPVDRAWLALNDYRDEDAARFTKAVGPSTSAASTAARSIATGYYGAVLGVPAPAISAAELAVAFDALAPFIATRKAVADGYPLDEAAVIGRSTAHAQVRNLTISTARRTGDVFVEKSGVRIRGWERNAEAKACPWCASKDGLIFHTAEAGDFGHDRCNCTVSPLVG